MADGIRFREFFVCDTQENRCIESTVEALFSYANIHDRSFDTNLDDSFSSLSSDTWNTAGATGTWAAVSNQLRGIGGGAAAWYYLLSNDDMPREGVMTVYKRNRGGILIRATNANNHYLVFWDANSVGVQKRSAGAYSTLVDVPKAYTGEGDLLISWREIKFRATADEKYLFISLWVDGELACCAVDDITGSTPGQKVGFAVYGTDTVYFDDVRIPELCEIVEISMDIGESPAGSLGRLLGRRHIKYFLRYDNTLRMWRPKAQSSAYTYDNNITDFAQIIDDRGLISHWRQVGAWEQADRFDTTLIGKGIQRFRKDDNAELTTVEACYDEAGYALQELKENSDRVDITVPAQVLQEPEDVVTVYFERDGNVILNSLDYIIDLGRAYSISYRDGRLKATLHLRREQ